MTTNAIPLSAGIASKKLSSASKPPADAPSPTTKEGAAGFTFFLEVTDFAVRSRDRCSFFPRRFAMFIARVALSIQDQYPLHGRFSSHEFYRSLDRVRRALF